MAEGAVDRVLMARGAIEGRRNGAFFTRSISRVKMFFQRGASLTPSSLGIMRDG